MRATCYTFDAIEKKIEGENMTNEAVAEPAGPKGIRGWLILPALATFASIALNVYAAFQSIQTLQALTTKEALPGIVPFIWVELFCQLAIMAGWIYVAVLLLKHKRRFPATFVALLVVTIVFNILDITVAVKFFSASVEPDDIKTLVRGVVALAIWAPYMTWSKRVRNTFVD
jgi:hypothetical protein